MLESIMSYITIIAPAAAAIIAEVIALLMVIFKSTKAIKEIHGSNDVKILKEQMALLIQDNKELREREKEIVEALTQVKNRRE